MEENTKSEYKGRVALLITYQWNDNFTCSGESIILDKDFESLEEAYDEMEAIMPEAYDWDDGDDFDEWNNILAEDNGQTFVQYACNVDSGHTFLAVFTPIK